MSALTLRSSLLSTATAGVPELDDFAVPLYSGVVEWVWRHPPPTVMGVLSEFLSVPK